MTKKELQELHCNKSAIQITEANFGRGKETRYVLMLSLTAGELYALENRLTQSVTEVGQDLAAYLQNAKFRAQLKG